MTGSSFAYRAGLAVTALTALLTIWINLTVGVIGAEDDPRNLVYFAAVGMAATGAVVAAGRAHELCRTMGVVAATMVAIAVLHIARVPYAIPVDLGFATLWLAAALLFRRAAA